jgi:phospholipid/cholesterol/gamma-HCH transport system substrate-binding protein
METRPPTFGRILIAVGFAISCFALALFLWLAFGGTIPLKPEGYRVTIPFNEATQLAVESDVRISGVSVGKVKRVDLNDAGDAEATIELDSEFAPIPTDTRAILRQKTLLGETYVELSPGSREDEPLPEDGTLARAQVSDAVQLDEIFRTFDSSTRAAFKAWMQGQAASLRGRGDDFSVAIASLDPFAREADRALRLLDSERQAVSGFFRNTGEVFQALSERQGQLRGLIQSSATVFETTARRDQDLATAFTIFPTFLRESRETIARLERFAVQSDPTIVALEPTAEELTPTAQALERLSPVLDSFFKGLDRTISVGPRGSEALRRLLGNDLPPILERFDPWLAELNSILKGLGLYKREITAALGNVAAATNGFLISIDPKTGEPIRYLRTEAPLMPESVSTYPNRLQIDRTNPYVKPGGYLDVRTALKSFETRHCSGGAVATLPPKDATVADPAFNERTGGDLVEASAFYDRVKLFAFLGQDSTAAIAAPPCNPQAPYQSVGAPSETSAYQHYFPLP